MPFDRRESLLICAGLVGLLSGACSRELARFHYRLTFVVETPEGPKTASRVYGLTYHATYSLGAGHMYPVDIMGEAIVVELGGRGALFVLMGEVPRTHPASRVRLPGVMSTDSAGGVLGALSRAGKIPADMELDRSSALMARLPPAELDNMEIPALARFRDERDPSTVEFVDPSNLAASFGLGVKLRSVTVQITKEPVSPPQIKARLPWLATLTRGAVKGIPEAMPRSPEYDINVSHFGTLAASR